MRRKKRKEKKKAGEQDISTKIHTHEQALQCISEVMQFAIDSNCFRFLELLYTVKDCIQNDMNKRMFLCWICGKNLNELYIGNV
jgi:hypothetical protein